MDRLNEITLRKAEIKTLLESDAEVDLEELRKELDSLDAEERTINGMVETEQRKEDAEAEERKANAEAITKGDVIPDTIEIKEDKMEITKNSKEYIDAYARYIKTGKEEELRSLLTENVGGTIAVPEVVYAEVKHAWENEGLMALVNKVSLKGNLKVNFEISSDGAVKHTEGSGEVNEEALVEGIATLVPASIKKWIGISDEVMDMRGEEFLHYIYAELGQKIAKKCADELVGIIAGLPATATATTPSAQAFASAPAMDTIATAIGMLSDEATNPTIVMNKLTWSAFKKAQYAANFSADIFEGLKVVFNNSLPAYDSASAGGVYAIVGDFGYGAMANFPNGVDNIEIKFDNMTMMTSDIVRILGREYVGLGAVACDSFTLIKKPTTI